MIKRRMRLAATVVLLLMVTLLLFGVYVVKDNQEENVYRGATLVQADAPGCEG
ncbi:hypothetical protein LJC42_07055 [Eubacteriales bacterium OttesenSCG-928-K08]|nr:hypothetical protein [Eubacteriales bacterium OttesenSCG-928-K08]